MPLTGVVANDATTCAIIARVSTRAHNTHHVRRRRQARALVTQNAAVDSMSMSTKLPVAVTQRAQASQVTPVCLPP
jgi:hypothetical protein